MSVFEDEENSKKDYSEQFYWKTLGDCPKNTCLMKKTSCYSHDQKDIEFIDNMLWQKEPHQVTMLSRDKKFESDQGYENKFQF